MPKTKQSSIIEHKMFNISFPFPDRGVNFHWCYQNSTSLHEHDFYEFIVIIDGKAKHFHRDKTSIASKGMLFLIKPGEFHQFLPHHNHEARHINFSIAPTILKELTDTVWHNDILQKINHWEMPSNLILSQ